jgi:hypothetical protein
MACQAEVATPAERQCEIREPNSAAPIDTTHDSARTQTRKKLGKKMAILGRKNSQGPRCENLDDVFLLLLQ